MKLESGPKILQVTKIALKKKLKAMKCSNHLTISVTAHTAKMAAMMLRGRMERKIEDALGEISLNSEEETQLGM